MDAKALDFWLGEWDCAWDGGHGTNSITLELDDAVVIERFEALAAASLEFHFGAHARGTPAEGARLDLRVLRLSARCPTCGAVWQPEHHVLVCPACGGAEGQPLSPAGLAIESMDVEP